MNILLAQVNSHVGDIELNTAHLFAWCEKAVKENRDLIIFPELFLTGYPPKDLLLQDGFVKKAEDALGYIQQKSIAWPNLGILVGAPVQAPKSPLGDLGASGLHNSAILISNGHILGVQHKSLLPSYDVFDEHRWFLPAKKNEVMFFKGKKIGVLICEDAWAHELHYPIDPVKILCEQKPDFLAVLMASPYYVGKPEWRLNVFQAVAKRAGVPVYAVNQIGAQDGVIFDGGSFVLDGQGNSVVHALQLPLSQALQLGIKDYFQKNGFQKAVLGLSGGIDSSVVAVLAVNALGAENVHGILMPSEFSSGHSLEDAKTLANSLNIQTTLLPINTIYQAYLSEMKLNPDEVRLTHENIQARIRGNLLMAYASEHHSLVLSTGNKSELAVGYCTLYGDMCGALAVIGDLWKTQVYQLARELGQIPESVLTKAPSAELRPNQTDQDSLPDYETLDAILSRYIEKRQSKETIIRAGFDEKTVSNLLHLLACSEHKRKQAAPVLKVSPVAFGEGRQMILSSKL